VTAKHLIFNPCCCLFFIQSSRWRSQDTFSSINTFPSRISRNVAPLSSGYSVGSRRVFWTPHSLVSVICFPSARRHVAFRSDGFICRMYPLVISLLTAIHHAIVHMNYRGGDRPEDRETSDPLYARCISQRTKLHQLASGVRLLASLRLFCRDE